MKIIILSIGVALMATVFISCSDLGSPNIPVPFENISEVECLRVPDAGSMVINDDSTWIALWDQHIACMDGQGNWFPAPNIDFSENTVIAVFWMVCYS